MKRAYFPPEIVYKGKIYKRKQQLLNGKMLYALTLSAFELYDLVSVEGTINYQIYVGIGIKLQKRNKKS